MNPSDTIKHIKEQITSLLAKEVSSNYSWFNLIFKTPAVDLSNLNWSQCDYYQSIADKNSHIHAYGISKSFQISETNIDREERIQQLNLLYKNYAQQCLVINEESEHIKNIPLAYCQVAFDQNDKMSGVWQGFDNAKLIIPQLLFLHQAEQTLVIISIKKQDNYQLEELFSNLHNILLNKNHQQNSPTSKNQLKQKFTPAEFINNTQTKQQWKQQVNRIKQQLKSNTVSKIVLARQVDYQFSYQLNIKQLIETLLKTYPDCTIMMLKSAHSYLIACSPEQLVKVNRQKVYCDTVGGTTNNNQSEGQNAKLKHEHIIIREHIHRILKQYCNDIVFSEQPSIKKYLHLSHLYTHFSAKAKEPISVLQMAARLHPTPAVCGIPVQQAKNWITENETFNRGLYSGFSGWLDAAGEGEMNVILRCAVLKKITTENQATFNASFFAGAGIVNGSIDEEEWQETELKLKMLLHSIQQVHQQHGS